MSHHRASLPDVKRRHLHGLQILNETGYHTRTVRTLVIRALRAQGMRVAGAVRVVYSGGEGGHHGCAAIGESVRLHGLNMALSLPRDPGKLDVAKFALVIRHEVMHWRGVRHSEMTDDQLYCRGTCPAWAEGVTVSHHEKVVPTQDERRERKLVHAQSMLRRAETRLRRATTIVKRWKRRVAAAERALRTEPKMVKLVEQVPAAADREEK